MDPSNFQGNPFLFSLAAAALFNSACNSNQQAGQDASNDPSHHCPAPHQNGNANILALQQLPPRRQHSSVSSKSSSSDFSSTTSQGQASLTSSLSASSFQQHQQGSSRQTQQHQPIMDPQQQLLALIALHMSQQQQQPQHGHNVIPEHLLETLTTALQGHAREQQLQQPSAAASAAAPSRSHHFSPSHEFHTKPPGKQDPDILAFQNEIKALREAAQNRGSKILVCRARGMPADHNADTAFLEVPRYEPNTDSPDDSSKTSDDSTASKALHGLELVCSHPSCRNKGVKFLYCFYCEEAVSRRCFRSGHSHEDRRPLKRSRNQPHGAVRQRQQLLKQGQQDHQEDAAHVAAVLQQEQQQEDQEQLDSDETRSEIDELNEISSSSDGSRKPRVRLEDDCQSSKKKRGRSPDEQAAQDECEQIKQQQQQLAQAMNQPASAAVAVPPEPPAQRLRRMMDNHANISLHNIPPTSSSTEDNFSSSSDDDDEKANESHMVLDPALAAELSSTKNEWDALLDERQEMGSNDDVSDWLDRVFAVSCRYRATTDLVNAARSV